MTVFNKLKYYNILAFLIGFITLASELVFTKILAFIFWNHLVYLIISIALLGHAISSSIVVVGGGFLKRFEERKVISSATLLMAFCLILSLIILSKLQPNFTYDDPMGSLLPMLMAYFTLLMPFIIAGVILIYLLQNHHEKASKLYGYDLIGAALGCCSYPLIMKYSTPQNAIIIFTGIFTLIGVIFITRKKYQYILTALAVIAFYLLLKLNCFSFLPDKTKSLGAALNNELNTDTQHEFSSWDPITRLDIVSSSEPINIGWNTFPKGSKLITFDGDAISGIDPRVGTFPDKSDLDQFRRTNPIYPIIKHTEKGEHLIIGLGGGGDIANSLLLSAKKIVSVDINESIINAMTNKFREFSGNLFTRPQVELIHSEGRAYLQKETRSFDLIRLRGVDTFSAMSTGAYVLVENHLYTIEAIRSFYQHLKSDGVLVLHRWLYTGKPRETLRLFATALEALRLEGVPNPENHIAIVRGSAFGNTIVRKSAFTKNDVLSLQQTIPNQDLYPILFLPHISSSLEHSNASYFSNYSKVFEKGKEKEFQNNYEYDISPVTDDRPFFFNYYRIKKMFSKDFFQTGRIKGYWAYFVIAIVFICAVMVIALFILCPMVIYGRKELLKKESYKSLVYFATLGLGFMMIEITLMQRFSIFLGNPMYSIAVTMSGVLLFSGLGSYLSGLWCGSRVQKNLAFCAVGVALFCLFFASPLPAYVFNNTMGAYFPIKVVLTLIIIGPISLLLGCFFPVGVKKAHQIDPLLIPWAWSVNGGFSVIGSVLTIVIAMGIGFSKAFIVAGILYFFAYISFRKIKRSAKS